MSVFPSRLVPFLLIVTLALAACGEPVSQRSSLRETLDLAGVEAIGEAPPQDPAMVELGRLLFFDPELSGNRDTSCATCHHPKMHSGDDLSLSIGTGGSGLGSEREMGEGRELVPRNATEIFNRGHEDWRTMFWDLRVRTSDGDAIISPAGGWLPPEIENVLQAQAMFPVTSRDEMRGEFEDVDVFGEPNELAMFRGTSLRGLWQAIMDRLLRFEGYREQFAKAFPDVPEEELGFQHAAIAIAAFEIEAFSFSQSPFDRYLEGDEDALSEAQKRGAELFFGKARCSSCHSGTLLTDQKAHNIAIPQLGPGRGNDKPLDLGFGAESGRPSENFAFRTPPLRNVTLTGPWMHNGAYLKLEDAARHSLDAINAFDSYDPQGLPEDLRDTVQRDVRRQVLETLAPEVSEPVSLTDEEFSDLMAFLESLTDPAAEDLDHLVPDEVPSSLEVER